MDLRLAREATRHLFGARICAAAMRYRSHERVRLHVAERVEVGADPSDR
jgi:hypothetical protein